MSNAYAIGAVTAVIRSLLQSAMGDGDLTTALGGAVPVSVGAPDQIKTDSQDTLPPQLNLFLYHVEPNAAWRNRDLPSRDDRGGRTSNPMLALDLHYLLTAYGIGAGSAFHPELVLGHAALMLHEVPVLTRPTIEAVLEALPDGPLVEQFQKSRLKDQIEMIKITPQPMSLDEMSKLWSALQSHYRPSLGYHVSVVLIESDRPARTPMPVLQRVFTAVPSLVPPFPGLDAVVPPNDQPSVRAGEKLKLEGHDLSGTTVSVVLQPVRGGDIQIVPPDTATAAEVVITMPALPAGIYNAAIEVTKSGVLHTTNALPFALAPKMRVLDGSIDATFADGPQNSLIVTIADVTPVVQPGQRATLVIGHHETTMTVEGIVPQPALKFTYAEAAKPPTGIHYVRLRVDGVESLLIRRDPPPPAFDDTQKLTIP
ncbi:MAG: DUF4255 domain-containing protein [Acidobacteriota bacterium]|nr:DUF4255 domain-containing protein [Acidobacteriota bacterium]